MHFQLLRGIVFIKTVPTCGSRMPDLKAYLGLRARVGVATGSVVVVTTPGGTARTSTTMTARTTSRVTPSHAMTSGG
jgi:hypothetical protein